MKKEILKAEAKRLRSAITEMFGIPVSTSQSLELIAKAKNFPSWGAASGSAIQSERSPLSTTGAMPTAKRLEELGLPDDVLGQLRVMVASTAGLFLVAGSPPSGRSTTLAAVMLEAIAAKHKVATRENPVERVITGASQYVADKQYWHEAIKSVMRSDPDFVMMHELRDRLSAEAAAECVIAGTQVWAGITSRLPTVNAVMETLRAIDPDGRATNLVRGIVWQSLTDDGRIEARILLRTEHDTRPVVDMLDVFERRDPLVLPPTSASIRMNPLKDAAENTDWTVKFLVAASGITVPADVQDVGREVLAVHANKGEVTLLELVNAFDRVPALREWAAALRKATLPGPFAQLFSDPASSSIGEQDEPR